MKICRKTSRSDKKKLVREKRLDLAFSSSVGVRRSISVTLFSVLHLSIMR